MSCCQENLLSLRLVGLLGLKTELNCPLRAFALSESSENVLPLAFSNDIPLESCFECFKREYSFLVLTLGGSVRVICFIIYA